MAGRFGPTRGEAIFRLIVGIGGLILLAVAIALRGLPEGPGLVEVVGVSGLFFGGTVIWALRHLWRDRKGPDGEGGA